MTVQSDIAAIKTMIEEHEAVLKRALRSARKLHNMLAAGAVEHAPALGLSEGDIIAFGGGTPKDEDPE